MGLDDRTGRLRPEGPVGLKKREVVVEAVSAYLAASGYAEPEEVCRDAFARADERSLQRLGDFVAPINGAAELLRALREAGCLVALATVDLHERANLTLEHLGWSNLFDLVVGGDEVARAKPHPEAVERVLAALQVAPGRAVMIGDALNDVRMGIDAGIAAVGVTTGFASRAELLTATPLVAASVRDIEIVPAPA
jgi:AHBA synthesis associated protein